MESRIGKSKVKQKENIRVDKTPKNNEKLDETKCTPKS